MNTTKVQNLQSAVELAKATPATPATKRAYLTPEKWTEILTEWGNTYETIEQQLKNVFGGRTPAYYFYCEADRSLYVHYWGDAKNIFGVRDEEKIAKGYNNWYKHFVEYFCGAYTHKVTLQEGLYLRFNPTNDEDMENLLMYLFM